MMIDRLKQRGLSLVELMISLTVGSIITAGVVQLFTANSEAYQMLQGQARIQESARFAIEFLRRDIENAGNFGCNSNMFPGAGNFVLNQQNADIVPYEFDVKAATVTGYDGQDNGTWQPSLGDLPATVGGTSTNTFVAGTGIDTSAIVPGTDVLVLRGIEGNDVPHFLAEAMPTSDAVDIKITPPTGGASGLGFSTNDLVLIHDCEKATLFQVTEITDANPILLKHAIGTQTWSNLNDRLSTISSFDIDAAVSAMVTTIYYVAPGTGENTSGDIPLSLWRKQGVSAPVEMVEGIEDFQVVYGTGTTPVPTRYVTANQIGNDLVSTVRVSIVANTVDDIGGAVPTTHGCDIQTCYPGETGTSGIDGLQRRPFARTIALKN